MRENTGETNQVIEYFSMYLKLLNPIKVIKIKSTKEGQYQDFKKYTPDELKTMYLKKYKKEISVPFAGNVYISTSNKTFSATMDWAQLYQDNHV